MYKSKQGREPQFVKPHSTTHQGVIVLLTANCKWMSGWAGGILAIRVIWEISEDRQLNLQTLLACEDMSVCALILLPSTEPHQLLSSIGWQILLWSRLRTIRTVSLVKQRQKVYNSGQ